MTPELSSTPRSMSTTEEKALEIACWDGALLTNLLESNASCFFTCCMDLNEAVDWLLALIIHMGLVPQDALKVRFLMILPE